MDNHSGHITKETQAFLSQHPNRFQYMLTPEHGPWLNMVIDTRERLPSSVQ